MGESAAVSIRPTASFVIAFLSLALGASVHAAPTGTDLVKADMVADSTSIRAGQSFRLAVKLKIEPHWHIYWSNPGETGQATKVKLQLPDGFTASDIQYPAPKRFVAAGDITGYGYEDETVLLATITPPATIADNATQNLSAAVSWLVCSEDLCLPGKTSVSLQLPVNEEPEPANVELFKKWSARVPVKPEQAKEVASAEAKTPSAGSEMHTFVVNWKQAPKEVDWFAPAVKVVNFENVDVKTSGDKTTITCTATALAGQKLPTGVLDSVIVYKDESGEPKGIIVPFELVPSNKAGDTVSRRD